MSAHIPASQCFCIRRKTSKKSSSAGRISSKLQNKPPTQTFCKHSALRGLILLAVVFRLTLLNRLAYGFETFKIMLMIKLSVFCRNMKKIGLTGAVPPPRKDEEVSLWSTFLVGIKDFP